MGCAWSAELSYQFGCSVFFFSISCFVWIVRKFYNRPIENNLDIGNLALNLSGYTCSDIKFIVNEAAKLALTRNSSISTTDFTEILQNTAPSVSFEKIEKYESFKNI